MAQEVSSAFRSFGRRGKGFTGAENAVLRVLKGVHVLSATGWSGGVLSMAALSILSTTTPDQELARYAGECLRTIDAWVTMPGLIGCILTGSCYSFLTSIGFVKAFWVGYKWLMSLCAAFWGTIFLGPWGNRLIALADPYGLGWAFSLIRTVLHPETPFECAIQILFAFTMILMSIFRPVSLTLGRKSRPLS